MKVFHTRFEEGEEIVFGPVSATHPPHLDAASGLSRITISPAGIRKVCVTDRRIIVETGRRAVTVPNKSIKTVFIERKTSQDGSPELVISRLFSAGGQSIKLDVRGLAPEDEARIRSTFPNAQIKEGQSLPVGLPVALVILIGLVSIIALVFYLLQRFGPYLFGN